MTPNEQIELDTLKQQLRQTQALYEQEKGKRIAIERDSAETKRQAKIAHDQAEALVGETQASLGEAAEQMKVALCVSQGVWALGQMCKAYTARKAQAARVVFREMQATILMQQAIDAYAKGDAAATMMATDKMKALIQTVKADGEASRVAGVESALWYGFKQFEATWDQLISENNHVKGC